MTAENMDDEIEIKLNDDEKPKLNNMRNNKKKERGVGKNIWNIRRCICNFVAWKNFPFITSKFYQRIKENKSWNSAKKEVDFLQRYVVSVFKTIRKWNLTLQKKKRLFLSTLIIQAYGIASIEIMEIGIYEKVFMKFLI